MRPSLVGTNVTGTSLLVGRAGKLSSSEVATLSLSLAELAKFIQLFD